MVILHLIHNDVASEMLLNNIKSEHLLFAKMVYGNTGPMLEIDGKKIVGQREIEEEFPKLLPVYTVKPKNEGFTHESNMLINLIKEQGLEGYLRRVKAWDITLTIDGKTYKGFEECKPQILEFKKYFLEKNTPDFFEKVGSLKDAALTLLGRWKEGKANKVTPEVKAYRDELCARCEYLKALDKAPKIDGKVVQDFIQLDSDKISELQKLIDDPSKKLQTIKTLMAGSKCFKCGCYMNIKTGLAGSFCYVNKWKEIGE